MGYGHLFGPSVTPVSGHDPGSWVGGSPDTSAVQSKPTEENGPVSPLVEWARNARAVLKREKQSVTEEMTRATNLFRGGTPWWRHRIPWKISTKLNYCSTVPLQWAAILTDNDPTVTYSAFRQKDQHIADIASSAFKQAYEEGDWRQRIYDCILNSRVQKAAFLRLVPDPMSPKPKALLRVVTGDQLYFDRPATCVDDAEVILYETRESFGSVCARFPKIAEKLRRKRSGLTPYSDQDSGSVLSPPATMQMPTGSSVSNPPYAASPNPPDNASGTLGVAVSEFWLRPHTTTKVQRPLFTVAGEPAVNPKMFRTMDGEGEEPLRRVITENNVVYELPESLVGVLRDAAAVGSFTIIDDVPAYECVMQEVEVPLYPKGRLVVIVDGDLEADARMNPLGYIPFIKIGAAADSQGSIWGQSDIDLIADPYEGLVRTVSMLYDAANLTANPIWRIPDSEETSDDDITNAPGAIQRESIASLRYGKREQGPDMPAYVMNLVKFYIDQIERLSGLTEMATGKLPAKAQVSTETISMQQDAAGVRFRAALHDVQQALVILGQQFLEFMATFYTSPVLIQLKTDAGVIEATPLLGSHLTAPLRVEAKAGSMMPNSPSARLNAMLALLGSGKPLVDLPTVWALLQEVGAIDSASGLQRRIEKEIANPATRWLVPGFMVPGAPTPKKPNSRRSKKKQ